jgi:hypothetical protein
MTKNNSITTAPSEMDAMEVCDDLLDCSDGDLDRSLDLIRRAVELGEHAQVNVGGAIVVDLHTEKASAEMIDKRRERRARLDQLCDDIHNNWSGWNTSDIQRELDHVEVIRTALDEYAQCVREMQEVN